MRLSKRRCRIWQTNFLHYHFLWKNIEEAVTLALADHNSSGHPVVLDVGCGNKPYADLFVNCEYIGMDSIDSGSKPDIVGDAQKLPCEDESVDIVFCTQVIEHLPRPWLLFEEAFRVLRPGGKLIITAPFVWPLHEVPHDFFRFSRYGLQSLTLHSGFILNLIKSDGGDWAQICCSICHFFNSKIMAPLRIAINLCGLSLNYFAFSDRFTLNHTLIATKPCNDEL